jgi:hypothetical protein
LVLRALDREGQSGGHDHDAGHDDAADGGVSPVKSAAVHRDGDGGPLDGLCDREGGDPDRADRGERDDAAEGRSACRFIVASVLVGGCSWLDGTGEGPTNR